MHTTRLSSKGQVVLPSATRATRGWTTGTEFAVEETPEGVLLRPLKPFAQTRVEEVFGMARYQGPKRSLKDMAEAVLAEARKRK
ncbi:MAG: AbrB/MazE/SpoVT family DNA-binding domain-containing protein [Gammaproteobacteria bacterium]